MWERMNIFDDDLIQNFVIDINSKRFIWFACNYQKNVS